MLKLIIEDDEGRKTVVPFVRDEITIGRQEGNTIRLTERNVSRRHARLMRQNGHVLIEDLGSYNGIRINGDRIAGQVQVGDGDLIQIGDYDLALQAEGQAATVPLESTTPRALSVGKTVPLVSDPGATIPALPTVEMPQAEGEPHEDESDDDDGLGGEGAGKYQSTAVIRVDQVESNRKRQVAALDPNEAPRLVVLNTDFAGREFLCLRTELKIGRTDDNDVALDHRSLSRTHCKVVREDNGEWRVIDLQSANGLMVNGEPYAQVTLRFGDVIELGHVKLRFVGPGEAAPAPAFAPLGTSDTHESVQSGSKTPLLAVVVTVLVIIVGGGGYAAWKSMAKVEPKQPPPPKLAVTDPRTAPDPDPAAEPRAEPSRGDPESARRLLAERISLAKVALESLDWAKAESLLKDATVDGAVAPEAQALLNQMDAERGQKKALEDAKRLLDSGEDDKAKPLLDSATGTKLMRATYEQLETRRAKLFQDRLAKRPPPPQPGPGPAPVQPVRAAGKNDDADALLKEATDLASNKQLDAAKLRLERCISIAPTYFPCYKKLGSVYGKISSRDQSASDYEKAVKYYERYLEYAPADDEDRPKVQNIVDLARQQK